jgi:hypothetical protein
MDGRELNLMSVVQDVAIYPLTFISLIYTGRHLRYSSLCGRSREGKGLVGRGKSGEGEVLLSLSPESMLGWRKIPCATDDV